MNQVNPIRRESVAYLYRTGCLYNFLVFQEDAALGPFFSERLSWIGKMANILRIRKENISYHPPELSGIEFSDDHVLSPRERSRFGKSFLPVAEKEYQEKYGDRGGRA